jgi:hypothetical protein
MANHGWTVKSFPKLGARDPLCGRAPWSGVCITMAIVDLTVWRTTVTRCVSTVSCG